MSQRRSGSLRGAVGRGDLEVVGRRAHALVVVRRERYLVRWSAVRGLEGAGWLVGEGWRMGVSMGVVEPSTEVFSGMAVVVWGALASRVPLECASVSGGGWEASVAMIGMRVAG